MQLKLEINVKYDLELLEKNIALPIIRLISTIEFKHGTNWSNPYDVIIDTGSPISVFPASIEEKCDIHLLHQTQISGLVPGGKCDLEAKLVNLTFRLSDKYNVSTPIKAKAYITNTDKIPLILGFADVLEKYDLCISCSTKKASLVIPDTLQR